MVGEVLGEEGEGEGWMQILEIMRESGRIEDICRSADGEDMRMEGKSGRSCDPDVNKREEESVNECMDFLSLRVCV